MMKKNKRFLAVLVCAVMLVGNAATVMAATALTGTRLLKDYFYVSVAMEGEATMESVSGLTRDCAIDIGGEIEDWGQAVFAGSSVSASLWRKSSAPSSTIAIPNVTFTWKFVKAGETTLILSGARVKVPERFAGGYVDVEASVAGNSIWATSKVASKISIG